MPLEVACTCGQRFTIYRSPAKISCFMCGRKFTVNPEDPPTRDADIGTSTAIQSGHPALAATAITSLHHSPIHYEVDPVDTSLALAEELRCIDNDWQIERLKYPGCARTGPDAGIIGSIAVTSLAGAVCLAAGVITPEMVCWFGLRTAASVGPAASALVEDQREYEKAHAAYLRRRTAALARHSGTGGK